MINGKEGIPIAVLIILVILIQPQVFAQTIEFKTTKEVTGIGLGLIEERIGNGDFAGASYYSKFLTNFYGKQVNEVRQFDTEFANELHIELLDLHSAISSNANRDQIINQIEQIKKLRESKDVESVNHDVVIINILTEADKQYQRAIQEENNHAYELSKTLSERAQALFESSSDIETRKGMEVKSFFDDLQQSIKEKEGFVSVANLITAIQRDLSDAETATLNQKRLYENIRELYSELKVALDNGDYNKAEELAIEAYLENFEYLEPDIEKVDPDLLYTLEIDMREELRSMIRDKQDAGSIKEFMDSTILPDLAKAEDLVTELNSERSEDNSDGGSASAFSDRQLKEMGETTEEEQSGVRNEIDVIRGKLEETLAHYKSEKYESAYVNARSAYLDSYEFVEIPLRQIAPDFTLEVEYQFAELRNLINDRASYEEVQDVVVDIRRNLDESERLVTGTGEVAPAIAFSASFAIIFREGLESVLILGAILTYLEASRNNRFKPYVYYGIIAAVAATVVTWYIASFIIEISGAERELVEAIAALSATAVLFYVSFWVLNKIEHKKWMEFVKAKVWQATTTGGVMVFVMLSFFTVYREGFETVLFYQAMFGFAKYMEMYVALGFVLGLISLFGIYYGMRKLGKRLPLRALFGLTMGIGAYLSIAFLGNAVRELQVLDIVSYTPMFGTIPRLDINMATMTGIYPTLETVIAQIVLLSVYLVAASYVLILRPRKERKLLEMRKSRKQSND